MKGDGKKLKLECHKCNKEVEVFVEMKGPHLKASCSKCGGYIKFLNKEEKEQLEKEEDKKELCEFYPPEEEIEEYGPFCACSSDISGGPPCTKEDEKKCQWANERRQNELNKTDFDEMEEGSA